MENNGEGQMSRMRYPAIFALLLSLVAGSVPGSEYPPFPVPDEQEMARLRAGEALLENDTGDESGAAAEVMIFVRAPVERIWAIIISCEYAHAFVAGLQFCEVLEERGDYALTRQVVDKGWASPRLDFTFETRRVPYRHMEFRLTRGDLKTMRGSWDFEALPDGVLMRHELVLQPVLPAPRWLVRRSLNQDLPNMMRCIRGLADGSGSDEAVRADRMDCPGDVKPNPAAKSVH